MFIGALLCSMFYLYIDIDKHTRRYVLHTQYPGTLHCLLQCDNFLRLIIYIFSLIFLFIQSFPSCGWNTMRRSEEKENTRHMARNSNESETEKCLEEKSKVFNFFPFAPHDLCIVPITNCVLLSIRVHVEC